MRTFALCMSALLAAASVHADVGKLYWTQQVGDFGGVRVTDLQSDSTSALTDDSWRSPYRIAVDPAGGRMYWTSIINPGFVASANFDGSDARVLNPQPFSGNGLALAVDPPRNRVCWSDSTALNCAGLDGSNITRVYTATRLIQDIAIDPLTGSIYTAEWNASPGTTGRLRPVALGGGATTIINQIDEGPIGVQVDAGNSHLYWAKSGAFSASAAIRRSNLTGGDAVTILTSDIVDSIALDTVNGQLFWSSTVSVGEPGQIRRANLNGTGVETYLDNVSVGGLTFAIPEPNSCASLMLGLVVAASRRRTMIANSA